jgi:DNA polymerase-3 subunit beta
MKFLCDHYDLLKALGIVSRAVTTRTTLPILRGILLSAKDEKSLTLSASDLDISIETQIDADIREKGSLLLPSKILGDMVRRLGEGEVSFNENEGGSVDIKCLNAEYRIMGMAVEEFPDIHGEVKGGRIILERSKMKEMIRKTCFAASVDETRGIITGVLMELKKNSVNMVALDGFRMAVVREQSDNEEERSIIIPASIMNEVGRIISDTEEVKHSEENKEKEKEGEEKKKEKKKEKERKFDILTDDKKVFFDLKNTLIVSRLLEGVFVKYEDIMPKEYKTSVILNKEELKDSVERASVLIKEGKNNFIKMAFSNGRLSLTSRNEEGTFRDEIITEQTGDDLEIGFNAKFLLDALKVIPDEDISLALNTSVTPCLIRPTEGNSYEYLVLPVRLSGA